MLFRIISLSCFVLLASIDIAESFQFPDGITLHKVKATWTEAQLQCQREGLVLASPINEKTIEVMKSIMVVRNTTYFIGTRARSTPGQYVSIEDIPLENMAQAVVNMIEDLDRTDGDCLSMDHDNIRVVPCWAEFSYICYDTRIYNNNHTNCGHLDKGYKYEMATGSCYKALRQHSSWHDAQAACVAEDAHLVIINNLVEDQIVKKMFDFSNYGWIFVGVHDVSGNGDWYSVHSQNIETLYNVWEGGQKSRNDDTRCGTINLRGELRARNCLEKRFFICEKPIRRN